MNLKTFSVALCLLAPLITSAQHLKTPKNLKAAVRKLSTETPDSVKAIIQKSTNDKIGGISYPWGKFKTVHTWTDRDNFGSRIVKYLDSKGVSRSRHQDEVILIAFRDYLNTGGFDESAILNPFQILEEKMNAEDKVRYSTDSLRGVYIPKDLQDCLVALDRIYSDSIKLKIKPLEEDEYVSGNYRFGMGLWIRNNWSLWGGSRLSRFFDKSGINHPESMSVVILESYHRYLIGSDIGFEKQVIKYKEFAEADSIRNLEDLAKERLEALEEFAELRIGDTLTFSYNYGFADQVQENQWMDNTCIGQGLLINKNDSLLTIQVRLIETCGKKGLVIYNNDDIHIYNDKTKKWVRPEKRIVRYLRRGKAAWFEMDDWH